MSIVVFWLDAEGKPAHETFPPTALMPALQLSEAKRRDGMRHVCISSEMADSVGKPGVTTVADGRLPDGHAYEWSKAGRAGATRRRR